jgi:hypothetical protein
MASVGFLARYASAALLFGATLSSAQEFLIANGQIFTPGLAIVNAPQPGTPLGGGGLSSTSSSSSYATPN